MQRHITFALSLPDPIGNRSVDVRFAGTIDASGDHNAALNAVQNATQQVLGGRLMRGELGFPTLVSSLPYVLPEIAQTANAQLAMMGASVAIAMLDAQVPQHAIAPAAAAIAAAPSPWQSASNNFTNNATNHVASHVPTGVNVHVGGWKIGVNGNGVNTNSLANQVQEKVKDKLLSCALVGGVVVVLGLITMGVIAKIILFG
jgi:hypothetical protein